MKFSFGTHMYPERSVHLREDDLLFHSVLFFGHDLVLYIGFLLPTTGTFIQTQNNYLETKN